MAIDIAESAELLHKKQAQTIERKACKNHTLKLLWLFITPIVERTRSRQQG